MPLAMFHTCVFILIQIFQFYGIFLYTIHVSIFLFWCISCCATLGPSTYINIYIVFYTIHICIFIFCCISCCTTVGPSTYIFISISFSDIHIYLFYGIFFLNTTRFYFYYFGAFPVVRLLVHQHISLY